MLGNVGGTLWKRACETNVARIEGYIYRSMGVINGGRDEYGGDVARQSRVRVTDAKPFSVGFHDLCLIGVLACPFPDSFLTWCPLHKQYPFAAPQPH